jgi:NAD(P)H-dependent FMN reductase
MKLLIIIASTRPGRIGDQIGAWMADYARLHSDFDVEIADLVDVNLPVFDERFQPMARKYEKDHTKRWSNAVDAADAFVVVTPEYNYNIPPSLLNAVDYLYHEWHYKAAGFVGYGAMGGNRAVQAAKVLLATLGVMPVPPSVYLVGVHARAVTTFVADMAAEQAADKMLHELHAWADALVALRAPVQSQKSGA